MFQPMADFLVSIDALFPETPSAVLVITAHWETDKVSLTSGEEPKLIYDYYNFPSEMYQLTYPAYGKPELAARISSLLSKAGIDSTLDEDHGFDHGVFVPLKVIYPTANIPVVAMSLEQHLDPARHSAIGAALRTLRDEGVLIIGSGMSYHNLSNFADGGHAAKEFDEWLSRILNGNASERSEQLNNWQSAPSARIAHPREEHLLPLMVASGAGSDLPAKKIWCGSVGNTRVSAWWFD